MTAAGERTIRSSYPAEVGAILADYPAGGAASAAIALLYLAQSSYGYVSAAAVDEVADIVGVPPSRVRSLLGFYTLLRRQPGGGWVIHFCTDLPCALRGAEDLLSRLCAMLSVEPGGTTADGLFTVEPVMCLAACDRAPVMQVNLAYAYDLDEPALDAILADLRRLAAEGAPSGPPFGLVPHLADQRPDGQLPARKPEATRHHG